MFSDLTKASYTNYLCSSALDLHEPAINAYTYSFFTCSIQYLSQNIFPRQVYMYIYDCLVYNTGFR